MARNTIEDPGGRRQTGRARVDRGHRRPEQHRRAEVGKVLQGVQARIGEGGLVQRREVGRPHDQREATPGDQRRAEQGQRPAVQQRQHQPAPGRRCACLQRQGQRPGQDQQGRGDQGEEQVLDHVDREPGGRPGVDRRLQRHRDRPESAQEQGAPTPGDRRRPAGRPHPPGGHQPQQAGGDQQASHAARSPAGAGRPPRPGARWSGRGGARAAAQARRRFRCRPRSGPAPCRRGLARWP